LGTVTAQEDDEVSREEMVHALAALDDIGIILYRRPDNTLVLELPTQSFLPLTPRGVDLLIQCLQLFREAPASGHGTVGRKGTDD